MNYVRSRRCSIPVPGNDRKGFRIMHKFSVIIYRLRRTLTERSHWIFVLVALSAFLNPMLTSPSEDNPTGNAGISVSIIALCLAAIAFIRSTKSNRSGFGRIPAMCVGVGGLVSAYLLVAATTGVHPRDPLLPTLLLLLFAVPAAALLATALFPREIKPPPNNHSPIEFIETRESQISVDPGSGAVCE